MKAFKMVIEYDGTAYAGWQYQPRDKTIQGELERTLTSICREPIRIHGSGRTDAGVHALAQVAHFHTHFNVEAERLRHSLNGMLNRDISILTVTEVDLDFHARISAKGKHYAYRVLNRKSRSAYFARYVWHVRQPLDHSKMQEALGCILGEHDFKGFCSAKHSSRTTIRTVNEAYIEPGVNGELTFHLKGSGFLRYMVRSLVGAVVAVGHGQLSIACFEHILATGEKQTAAVTAPAQGLTLCEVYY